MKTHIVTLTTRQMQIIEAALYTCAPTGGGSELFTLSRDFRQRLIDNGEHDFEELNALMAYYSGNVINDAVEAGVVERI